MTIAENLFLIWIVIGFANWARHLMICAGCRETLLRINVFVLQGIQSFGFWPFEVYELLAAKKKSKITHGVQFQEVTFEQIDGETDEQFKERVAREVRSIVDKQGKTDDKV